MKPLSPAHRKAMSDIDALIRAGQLCEATRRLEALVRGRPPREALATAASLARRVRRPDLSFRLLQRRVRPLDKSRAAPTSAETAEYAGALLQTGALSDGERLLEQTSATEYPLTVLLKGFAKIFRWDYTAAIPHLEEFLRLVPRETYEARVGRVNLAAALVFTETAEKARAVLEPLLAESREAGHRLLTANLLELTAQNEITVGNYDRALKALDEGLLLLPSQSGQEGFYIRKWKAIAGLMRRPDLKSHRDRLERLKQEVPAFNHWESLRDLDYHYAVATGDQAKLAYVFFGTPHPTLRARMLRRFEEEVPETLVRTLGDGPRRTTLPELLSRESWDGPSLKPDQLPQRLLLALQRDFYRPQRLGDLFEQVHAGEHFSPHSAPDRIYQGLRRLRRFLEENRLPLVIRESSGAYSLAAAPGWTVEVECSRDSRSPRAADLPPALDHLLQNFRRQWKRPRFSAREFMTFTGESRRTALRRLARALQAGVLERTGETTQTRYAFTGTSALAPLPSWRKIVSGSQTAL